MKAKYLTSLLLGLPFLAGGAFCADATGERLIIGTNVGTSSSWFLSGGVIGENNNASGVDRSLIVGNGNWGNNAQSSLLVGEYNIAEPAVTTLISGFGNWITAGADNLITGTEHLIQGGDASLVGGAYCTVDGGTASLVFGQNNYVNGSYSMVLGKGLIFYDAASTTAKTILGQYNKEIADPLLVVGNGTSAATGDRKNAFEVLQDGTVRIPKPQGDILMGEFGE